MSIGIINQTIRYMCAEISAEPPHSSNWSHMPETQLLHEVAVCVCGSQMLFELALAIADRLRDEGLLQPDAVAEGFVVLESRMISALASPVCVALSDGNRKTHRPRFKNRLASLLASTMQGIYGRLLIHFQIWAISGRVHVEI